jgi:hypothetical protein
MQKPSRSNSPLLGEEAALNFADSCLLSAGDKHPRAAVHRVVADTLVPFDNSSSTDRPQSPLIFPQTSTPNERVVDESCVVQGTQQSQNEMVAAAAADDNPQSSDDSGDEGPSNKWDVGMGMFLVIAVNTADFFLQLHTMTARLLSSSTGALRLQIPHSLF